MGHEDWLMTMAEVSIALAGFSSLAAVLRDQSPTESKINRTRLLTIVETSLSVLVFCIVPAVLHGLGVSEPAAFRFSAGLFLCGSVPTTWRGFRRYLSASEDASMKEFALTGFMTVMGALMSGMSGVMCVVGIPETSLSILYVMTLLGTLIIGAVNFAGFAASIANLSSDGPE